MRESRRANKDHSLPAIFIAWLSLAGLAVLYRLPALLNAGGLNSDAAVVGLQGRHLLHGEFTPYLWGAGYQSSFETIIAAFWFLILGAQPIALLLVPFTGFLVLLWFVFHTLAYRVGLRGAWLLSLILVFASPIANGVTISPPRMWCLTSLFFGMWLLDSASSSNKPHRRFYWGVLAGLFSIYLDFFALQFLPGFFLFAHVCTKDFNPSHVEQKARRRALFEGFVTGVVLLILGRLFASGSGGTASFSFKRILGNTRLLLETCLPITLGGKIFVSGKNLYPDLWETPWPFRLLQWLSMLTLPVGFLVSGNLVWKRRVEPLVGRLGIFGVVTAFFTVLGFVGSKMVSDMHSARYLAPLIWCAPFALAPLLSKWKAPQLGLLLVPYFVVISTIGWMSYAPGTRGLIPIPHARGQADEERRLAEFLRREGIQVAIAQYWLAYRLSFLFEENPIVTPSDPGASRYRPYQQAAMNASKRAHLFHPTEPRENPADEERRLQAAKIPYKRHEYMGFTILIEEHEPRG